ncbi:phosphate ABC transporter permease [Romeria aff. gracilis LEGE 07310]|uniref:Phosphate ABC transporter permease n=1 Tax=Vasconcelosia minhoensis LEGE 07310 TaxID=915328 RepID=A0A8J7DM78_9CYAN|nr:phosphate ABC transporter permease [Romeria gracilis]MBE9078351.1 phosphate ABC transporter permease [Romeria aff. gracilis LEGE 07310]
MLIPLTRKTFDQLVPKVGTADQYRYCWGSPADLLRRVLISVAGLTGVFALRYLLGDASVPFAFVAGTIFGLYWLWSPVYFASRRNAGLRRNSYSGFWRGRVLDAYVTNDVTGTEETVDKRGDLVIVENRERRLNLELGDRTGFVTQFQVPLQKDHRLIRPGDFAEMIVTSNREDLGRISAISDIYIPDAKLWVSDYPYLRKDIFVEVRQQLRRQQQRRSPPPPEPVWE